MITPESIFYHIYPLGFCMDKGILKINETIEHIKYVGANAVYLGPIFQSFNHGYDTSDYFWIDRRLGTNEDFKNVCENLHSQNIKVILDGVFNHVGREFWAFKDVKENKGHSRFCDWFFIKWDCNNRYNDGFQYQDWEGCDDLVKLNLKNTEVKNHIFEAIRNWVENYNIDGLRLDVAYCLDKDFLKELRNFCKNLKPDFWLMGETLHGDYNQWMNDEMLDSVTNYECYKGLFSSCNDKNMFEVAHSLKRQDTLYKDKFMYNFLDNHDVDRIASALKDKRDLELLYTLMYCMPGIPSIYYGSEIGLEGDKKLNGDKVLRPCIPNLHGNDLTKHIHNLSQIKKEYKSLNYGKYTELLLNNEVFAFGRETDYERTACAINISEHNYHFKTKFFEADLPPKSSAIFVNGNCVLMTKHQEYAIC